MPKYHRGAEPDAIAPDGIEIRTLVDEAQGARQLSVAEGRLAPGQRSAQVYHTVYEEIWYFLSGTGVFHLLRPGANGDEAIQVGPGDTVLVSPLHSFWAENSGADDLIFLLCGSPPWGKGQQALPGVPGYTSKP